MHGSSENIVMGLCPLAHLRAISLNSILKRHSPLVFVGHLFSHMARPHIEGEVSREQHHLLQRSRSMPHNLEKDM